MTVRELLDDLKEYGVPDDAEVFVEADHVQHKESAFGIIVSRTPRDNECFGDPEAMIFEYDNWQECYDEDVVEEYDDSAPITAVLITY
jgi:hypothetical protein